MAFKKNVWQGSKFQEKISAEEASRRMGDGVTWSFDVNMQVKVIEIGDWNMDAVGNVLIPHGLGDSWEKVRSISVTIRIDKSVEDRVYVFGSYLFGPNDGVTQIVHVNPQVVNLTRDAGGLFDDPAFNDTSYNRGWVTIWYEV